MTQVSKKTFYRKRAQKRFFKRAKQQKNLYKPIIYLTYNKKRKVELKTRNISKCSRMRRLMTCFTKFRKHTQIKLNRLRKLWPQKRQRHVKKLMASFVKITKRRKKQQKKLNFKHKERTLLKPLSVWNKTKVTTYDKLFYYYTVKTPMSLYAHKCFILLEMQLNASLVRMKLVPYLFLVNELCFYRIVRLNGLVVSSPYHILSLYDNVSIPVSLYNYMYYRNYRVQHYPRQLAKFFKRY
jgi:ribosomal protein S4